MTQTEQVLLAACKGALACLTSGDLTPDMAIARLRNAISLAEPSNKCAYCGRIIDNYDHSVCGREI